MFAPLSRNILWSSVKKALGRELRRSEVRFRALSSLNATRRDATRPRLPSFFAPPRIYFSSSQVCGSLIIKSLCGKIYLPLPSFSLNRQKTVLDSCAHRNAPSTRNIQQKGKKIPVKNYKQTVQKVVQFLSPDSRRVQGTHWRNLGTSLTNAALHAFTKKWGFWIWLS